MRIRTLRTDLILLLCACIWGFSFVAQRIGMAYIGPFTYNALRFALGSVSLLPLLLAGRRYQTMYGEILPPVTRRTTLLGGALAGLALFAGSSLQQLGIVYTTAGKAGFITGLYVVLVPMVGLLWRQLPGLGTWLGAVLAVIGLYLLSITEDLRISMGDVLVVVSAFFWAGHVHLIGYYSSRVGSIRLAFLQFAVCSILSLVTALLLETTSLPAIRLASGAILFGGFFSVGVAFTLQAVAQRDARPAHAAIIMSLETVFAALGGWLMLHETLPVRGIVGCGVMLAGMLASQLHVQFRAAPEDQRDRHTKRSTSDANAATPE
ncbi:MAG TPA: EamA family transporter [Syntrophobacteraceae bacterium]|nr:EamA family transporter [Syntrophobacteraceae bacterium]HBD08913.1 EamA family transporter [Syntrophobacteraceae bacterium]